MKEDKTFSTLGRELRIRNYSRKTMKSYLYYNRQLLNFFQKEPREITVENIKEYLDFLVLEKSSSTVALALSAIKFYYKEIWHRAFFIDFKFPKKAKSLPVVLSKNEVQKIIENITNPKHNCIISLLYGTGMRVSEIVRLRMNQIDFDRDVIHIHRAKGLKDRILVLPQTIKNVLLAQRSMKRFDDFLFTNGRGGRLTEGSIQKIVRQAGQNAEIAKDISPHVLRHSFATHLLESGTDIRYIQSLLGHARLETTQIYTRVAANKLEEIVSPLDQG